MGTGVLLNKGEITIHDIVLGLKLDHLIYQIGIKYQLRELGINTLLYQLQEFNDIARGKEKYLKLLQEDNFNKETYKMYKQSVESMIKKIHFISDCDTQRLILKSKSKEYRRRIDYTNKVELGKKALKNTHYQDIYGVKGLGTKYFRNNYGYKCLRTYLILAKYLEYYKDENDTRYYRNRAKILNNLLKTNDILYIGVTDNGYEFEKLYKYIIETDSIIIRRLLNNCKENGVINVNTVEGLNNWVKNKTIYELFKHTDKLYENTGDTKREKNKTFSFE